MLQAFLLYRPGSGDATHRRLPQVQRGVAGPAVTGYRVSGFIAAMVGTLSRTEGRAS